MKDPFGLLEVTKLDQKEEKIKEYPKKLYLTVISILGLFIVILLVGFYVQSKNTASADVLNTDNVATVKILNLPPQMESSEQFTAQISVQNRGQGLISSSFVLVSAQGVNIASTINLAEGLTQEQTGYLRKLEGDEAARFEEKGESGFYWYVGDLPRGQSKNQQIKGVVTSSSNLPAKIEIKYLSPNTVQTQCGALGLKRCTQTTGVKQVASGVFQLNSTVKDKIKLKAGYNFISLPYVFTQGSLGEFFSSLTSKKAYVYSAVSAQYLDLFQGSNTSLIKPGIGFWVYDAKGGDYSLPQTKVETNINESYTLPLDIGWNQVGNPYTKRLILNQEKILIKELAEDGSESGTSYTLKAAIENSTLSKPFSVQMDASGAMTTKEMPVDSILSAYSGFLIKSTKKLNLVLPGKEIIASGDVITPAERAKIEAWINENGLNQYGDPSGTVYSGGTPLFNEKTGQTIDRIDYIIEQHPDRGWNK